MSDDDDFMQDSDQEEYETPTTLETFKLKNKQIRL